MSSASPPRVQLAPVAWDDPDLQQLAVAQQIELRARYDGGGEPGVPPSAADLGVILIARTTTVARSGVVPSVTWDLAPPS